MSGVVMVENGDVGAGPKPTLKWMVETVGGDLRYAIPAVDKDGYDVIGLAPGHSHGEVWLLLQLRPLATYPNGLVASGQLNSLDVAIRPPLRQNDGVNFRIGGGV